MKISKIGKLNPNYKQNLHKTLEEILLEFNLKEIPLCECRCGRKVNIKIECYSKYKKFGLPRFINHHNSKGFNNPMFNIHICGKDSKSFGKKQTEESNQKNRESHLGKCDSGMKGKFHTQESKDKNSKTNIEYYKNHPERKMFAEDNPMYVLDRTKYPISSQIRNSYQYDNWRKSVFIRDSFICQNCNKNKCYVEAHHKKELYLLIKENNIIEFNQAISCQELWNIDNGITLCEECHDKITYEVNICQ
jgi:hypothetical protein